MSGRTTTRPVGRISIGEVIRRLRGDFPDVSISKIRFLEAEGLVAPERSESGYRKFSATDVERLRYILVAQRDHYLPLKVIREHLDAIERGLEPPTVAGQAPRAPRPADRAPGVAAADHRGLRLSRRELLANAGLADDDLVALEGYGLVRPMLDGEHYDSNALAIASTVSTLAGHGLEPRHLRLVKTAADRQAGLIEQVVAPAARGRDEDAVRRVAELRRDLVRLITELHGALVSLALEPGDQPAAPERRRG